jgi:hypothetical protein
MAHSAVTFPIYYPFRAHALPPESRDYWFSTEELGQFIDYRQPHDRWQKRFLNAWPHRKQDGERRFSAYCVWLVLHERGQDFDMPPAFRTYFEQQHAALAQAAGLASA